MHVCALLRLCCSHSCYVSVYVYLTKAHTHTHTHIHTTLHTTLTHAHTCAHTISTLIRGDPSIDPPHTVYYSVNDSVAGRCLASSVCVCMCVCVCVCVCMCMCVCVSTTAWHYPSPRWRGNSALVQPTAAIFPSSSFGIRPNSGTFQ